MARVDDQPPNLRFYDVENYKRVVAEQQALPPPGRHVKLARRARRSMDSFSGIGTALTGIPIVFGSTSAVVIGILYGPIAFIAVLATALGLLTLYIERKVGKSLQFTEGPLPRKILAQAAGFALTVGLLYFMLALSDFLTMISRIFR